MYFAGIDAGGTKTAFVLCDDAGRIAARHRSGGGGFFSIGVQGVEKTVRDGIDALCAQAGISRREITWTGAGFPGYGEMKNSEQAILEACQQALGSRRVSCECDAYLGWAGSLGLNPGINIVAGTGAICFGVNAQGQKARSSGWGAWCDEGSCTWVGGHLIAEFAKQADGRKPRTKLYKMFREAMHIEDDIRFIHTLNHEIASKGSETAKLQMLAMQIAQAGDAQAIALYRQAADELCAAILAVADKLQMTDGFVASYSGGLFRSADCIIQPLRANIQRHGGTLAPPLHTPEIGAVLMAMAAFDPGFDRPAQFA